MRAWSHVKILNRDLRSTVIFLRKPKGISQTFRLRGRHWIQNDTALAKELYQTGSSDAMYLAGLICDGRQLSRRELDDWANTATWNMISAYTVPWVAVEHPEGWNAALEWIESPHEKLAVAGWSTLGGIVAVDEDEDLDLKAIEQLLDRVAKTIHQAPNHTRYVMNAFVIAKIGEVKVDMGDTACKVPLASESIKKVVTSSRHGTKRKTIKC